MEIELSASFLRCPALSHAHTMLLSYKMLIWGSVAPWDGDKIAARTLKSRAEGGGANTGGISAIGLTLPGQLTSPETEW